MSIELVMPSNHLILCRPLLLLPSIFPSIRIFSSELALHIRWPECWSFSFSISLYNEYSGLISFKIDWLDLLVVQGTLRPASPSQSWCWVNDGRWLWHVFLPSVSIPGRPPPGLGNRRFQPLISTHWLADRIDDPILGFSVSYLWGLGLSPSCSVSFVKCTHQKHRWLNCLCEGSLSSLQWSRQLPHVSWRPSQKLLQFARRDLNGSLA